MTGTFSDEVDDELESEGGYNNTGITEDCVYVSYCAGPSSVFMSVIIADLVKFDEWVPSQPF